MKISCTHRTLWQGGNVFPAYVSAVREFLDGAEQADEKGEDRFILLGATLPLAVLVVWRAG